MPEIKSSGIAHVTLTVSDIARTKSFYERLFEINISLDDDRSFSLLAAGIPCWFVEWEAVDSNDRFNENRVGLDHIAFGLTSLDDLKKMLSNLTDLGITGKKIKRFANKYPYVAFRDPDNIQVEFFIDEEL